MRAFAMTVAFAILTAVEAVGARAPLTLLQVVTPPARGTVPAHPFVNAIVHFGTLEDGTPADPDTFRARLGATDVTDRFTPIIEGEAIIGVRAAFEPELLKIDHGRNRLRLVVQSAKPTSGGRLRDKRKLRFRATTATNACPTVQPIASSTVIVAGVPIAFDATDVVDPEDDALDWSWDFGDGHTATGAKVDHAYAAPVVDRTVRVVVRDGGCETAATIELYGTPKPPPGHGPGLLRIEASGPLEHGPTAVGTSSTRTLTVRNDDPDPQSWINGEFVSDDAAFTIEPARVELPSGASADVTVRFAPGTSGHHDATITLAASAHNRSSVRMLAHGFGGPGDGTGPTLVTRPIIAETVGAFGELSVVLPGGARVGIDTTVGHCTGSTSACVVTADCRGGATCEHRFAQPFPVTDMCGDGQGGVYLLSDIAFEEPDPNRFENIRTAGIMRIDVGSTGSQLGSHLFSGLNADTVSIACDGFPAESGRVYVAERFEVDSGSCDRSERDALTRVRKKNGDQSIVADRIDEALGFDSCDEGDAVTENGLRVRPDGGAVYAAFDLAGIWRTMPTPLHYTPDVPFAWDMHPDGSLIAAQATPAGIAVYRLTPEQVAANPLPLAAVGPCAVVPFAAEPVPVGIFDLAVGPAADAAQGSVVVISATAFPLPGDAVPSVLIPQGLAAVALPAGTATCDVLGMIGLTPLSQMAF